MLCILTWATYAPAMGFVPELGSRFYDVLFVGIKARGPGLSLVSAFKQMGKRPGQGVVHFLQTYRRGREKGGPLRSSRLGVLFPSSTSNPKKQMAPFEVPTTPPRNSLESQSVVLPGASQWTQVAPVKLVGGRARQQRHATPPVGNVEFKDTRETRPSATQQRIWMNMSRCRTRQAVRSITLSIAVGERPTLNLGVGKLERKGGL